MYIPFRFFQSALIKSGGTLSTLSRHGQREQLLRQPGGCHGVSPWPAPGSWVTLTRHLQHLLSARLLSSLYSCRCFSFHFQKFRIKCMLVTQSAQSCLSLCNPMDCSSPPGSSVHWILQVRILQWVAISFSRGSSWPKHPTWVSHTSGRFFTIWATREALCSKSSPDFINYIKTSFTSYSMLLKLT